MSARIVEMEDIDMLVSWSVKQGLLEKMGVSGPDELGQVLHDENVRSVNYRYDESTVPDRYQHTPMAVEDVSDETINSLIGTLDYQCCETSDWNSSRANECLAFMEHDMLPRFQEAVPSLHEARHPMIVEALIEKGHDPNEMLPVKDDSYQNRPLHCARAPEIAESLIKNGADVGGLNKNLETPLHSRSFWGNPDTVQMLLDHGADPEARDLYGNTPLHSTTRYGRPDVAEMLVAAGADPLLKNKNGVSAYELAESTGKDITKSVMERAILAKQLQEATRQAAGAWSPDPKEADAQFDRRYAEAAAQGQGIEAPKASARMRL